LKSLLEESRFAASDFRLVDEETVAGILTEAGGEPAVIQPVEEDSFNKAWLVFFAGSPAFSKRNIELAKRKWRSNCGFVPANLSARRKRRSGCQNSTNLRAQHSD